MSVLEQAHRDAAAAASRSGVQVRQVDQSGYGPVRALFDTVWPSADGSSQVQANLLTALQHAGAYVSAAYDGGYLLGAALAFPGRHRTAEGAWEEHLHSHMAAVLPPGRDRGIGTALKLHQRWWALDRDIPVVTWTFDPLVRRNAHLNLVKLGVTIEGFYPDFYGEMSDGINSGDPTDRLMAWWEVGSARARSAARGEIGVRSDAEWIADGARLIALPEDIVAERVLRPDIAREWRLSLRDKLLDAFGSGARIETVSASGAYVLLGSGSA